MQTLFIRSLLQHFSAAITLRTMAKLYDVNCGPVQLPVCEYNGYRFAGDAFYQGHDHAKMTEHLEAIENMEVRDDDVILLTYPKSGTHLVREMCHMLQVERVEYLAEDLEFPLEYRNSDEIASLKSPRTLHSHLWYDMLPKQIREEKKGKAIAVFRNPKDVIVSYWHFCLNRFSGIPVDAFADIAMSGEIGCNSWYEWRSHFIEGRRKDEKCQILTLKFEDLLQDPKREILKIAKYLEKNVSTDFVHEIAKACEISTMREEKIKALPKDVGEYFEDGYKVFYRKGSVGDWKTDLPENVNALLDKWIASQKDDEFDEFPNYKSYYNEIS